MTYVAATIRGLLAMYDRSAVWCEHNLRIEEFRAMVEAVLGREASPSKEVARKEARYLIGRAEELDIGRTPIMARVALAIRKLRSGVE